MKAIFFILVVFLSIKSFAIELTEAEKEYITSHPIIKVHNESAWKPFNYIENNKPKGLSIDIINSIAQKVGLKVEYISGYTWSEFMDMMKTKELDVMLNIVANKGRQEFLSFTTPYQVVGYIIAINKDKKVINSMDDFLKLRIAVERDFDSHQLLARNYPDAKLVIKDDTKQALEAVAVGIEADATLGALPTIYNTMHENGINNLRLENIPKDTKKGDTFTVKEYRIATSKDNVILRDILQKGLDSLSIDEKNAITKKWIDINIDEISKINYELILEIILIASIFLLGSIFWIYRLKQLQKKLENSNLLVKTILDATPSPLFYKDKNAKFLGVNRAFIKAMGFESENLLGKTVMNLDYLPLKKRELYIKDDFETISKSINITRQEQAPFRDGNLYDVIYSVTGFKDSKGNAAGQVGLLIDISEQKEVERKLQSTMNKLEETYAEIEESIEYSRIIQTSMLSKGDILHKYFKDSYSVWQAKYRVGGDIYFFEELNENECIVFLIDCTGHGIPGALITVLVKAIEVGLYTDIKRGKYEDMSPAKLLKAFNDKLNNILTLEDGSPLIAGFDGIILHYNKKENLIKFASAYQVIMLLRDGKVIEYKGDRQSIGYKAGKEFIYTDYTIEVQKNDIFFLSTDGLYNQNGGEKGFPMGRERIRNILLENKDRALITMKDLILYELEKYQGKNERSDDISFLSFKI